MAAGTAPDIAATEAAPESGAPDAAPEKPPGRLRRLWNTASRKARVTWNFTKELFNDHTFWVKALAVKGGASAILVTGLVGISAMMSMPLLVAATGITLSVGLIGLSLYGMAAGGIKAWEGLQDVYARTTGQAPKEHVYKERKDMFQRLAETKFIQSLTHHKWAKNLAKTHAWRTTAKFTRNREDSVLGGIAVGGAALSLVVGAMALPFVAVGSLLTVATVFAVSSTVSGITGLYFSITGLREERRMKLAHSEKQKKAAAQPKLEATDLAPIGFPLVLPLPALTDAGPLARPFTEAAKMPLPELLAVPANANQPQQQPKAPAA
ncbi:MAG TPA: hypothetical protein VEF76_07950 [Patescibacteria group bacterium]|nr:hypothetical protein [Patescibacteria group bacterium]